MQKYETSVIFWCIFHGYTSLASFSQRKRFIY